MDKTNITTTASYRWLCIDCGNHASDSDALMDVAKLHAEVTGHTVEHVQAITLQPITIGQSQ